MLLVALFDEKLFEKDITQSNVLVDYINDNSFNYEQNQEKLEISAFDFFQKIIQDFDIYNPLLQDQKNDYLQSPYYYSYVFARSCLQYPKCDFFIPNFMSFFEKYFRNRNEKEIEYKYQIYEFINDEFKKIVGYKQTNSSASKTKFEIKKKKSGF